MKLTYTPTGTDSEALKLHDYGTIYIMGEEVSYPPDELAQTEVRVIRIKIEFSERWYSDNYLQMESVRLGLMKSLGRVKWEGERELDEDYEIAGEGHIYFDGECEIIEFQWPEGNVWGTTEQFCTFGIRYVVNRADEETHLGAQFLKVNSLGDPIVLGNVSGFSKSFKQTRYMEMRRIVDRASGSVTLSGQFIAPNNLSLAGRRQRLKEQLVAMETNVRGQAGQLDYGPSSGRMFSGVVKVDTFDVTLDQATWSLRWSMTASYTAFPNEDGFAAADFKVDVSDDEDSGDLIMTLSGTIAAATEQIAMSKLTVVRNAAMAANGYTVGKRISSKIDKGFLNTDDTQDAQDNPQNSSLPQKFVFHTVNFTEVYRRRMPSVLSYTLSIVDTDDTKSGLIQRAYSGSVVASGASDTAAYNTAAAKCRELGDNKGDFRMSGRIGRIDRKTTNGVAEHVHCDFNYDYQIKGDRIWIELSAEQTMEKFGDNMTRVSGFVVGPNRTAAEAAFQSQVMAIYAGQAIRGSSLTEATNKIELGTYTGPAWGGTGELASMFIRLEFQILIWTPKPSGEFSIKYGMSVETDVVRLSKTTSVQGTFWADPDMLLAAQSGTAGNKLDTFIAALGLGVRTKTSRSSSKEVFSDALQAHLSISFNDQFEDTLTIEAQLLECECTEEITYSSVRWNFGPVPDGPNVPQDCGIEPGHRTVSGSVVAATETAAMAWVKKIKGLPFPGNVGGGAAPAQRLLGQPRVSRSWEFLPLTDATARGTGTNARVCKITFDFPETLVDYPWRDN